MAKSLVDAKNNLNLNKNSHLPGFGKWLNDGGGGDRTRVPRQFRNGLYVCSRLFRFHKMNRLSTC